MSKMRAATPSATGTNMTSHVGLPTQFDSTSQNSVPRNDLQQPPLQKFGSTHPLVWTILSLIFLEYLFLENKKVFK